MRVERSAETHIFLKTKSTKYKMEIPGKQMSLLHRFTCFYIEAEKASQRLFYCMAFHYTYLVKYIFISSPTVPQEQSLSAQSDNLSKILHQSPFIKDSKDLQ